MTKMQALVALQKFSYGVPSRVLMPGDRFLATPKDAHLLTRVFKRAQIDAAVDQNAATETTATDTPPRALVEQVILGAEINGIPVHGAPRRGRRIVKTADND